MDLNDEVEVPPPYTDVPKGPPAPSYPSAGYAHPTAPTFEPPCKFFILPFGLSHSAIE